MKIKEYNYGIAGTVVGVNYFRTFLNVVLIPLQLIFKNKINKIKEQEDEE